MISFFLDHSIFLIVAVARPPADQGAERLFRHVACHMLATFDQCIEQKLIRKPAGEYLWAADVEQ
jgi:hypothetical protein